MQNGEHIAKLGINYKNILLGTTKLLHVWFYKIDSIKVKGKPVQWRRE
jgi:hypothetical protein